MTGRLLANRSPSSGMSCRFPGADDTASFWRLLREGVDAVTEIPAQRWDVDAHYDPNPAARDKMYTRWGAFVPDPDLFDADFFGMAPREAMFVILNSVWHWKRAGKRSRTRAFFPNDANGQRTGVFFGVSTHDYLTLQIRQHAEYSPYVATGNSLGCV